MGGGLGLIIVCVIGFELFGLLMKKAIEHDKKHLGRYTDEKGNKHEFNYIYDEETGEYKKIG